MGFVTTPFVEQISRRALAAKILGYRQLGLAPILLEHFGISLDKKWQRYDWADALLETSRSICPLRHPFSLFR